VIRCGELSLWSLGVMLVGSAPSAASGQVAGLCTLYSFTHYARNSHQREVALVRNREPGQFRGSHTKLTLCPYRFSGRNTR